MKYDQTSTFQYKTSGIDNDCLGYRVYTTRKFKSQCIKQCLKQCLSNVAPKLSKEELKNGSFNAFIVTSENKEHVLEGPT
jgi:hypothetical protein